LYEVSSKEETSPAMMTVKRMKVIGGGDGSGGDGGIECGIGNAGAGGGETSPTTSSTPATKVNCESNVGLLTSVWQSL